MAMYYNGKKVRNLYFNGKCITRLALGKEMTRLVEGDDFVRAEWLKGRNGAFINTLHKLAPCDDAFECHFKWDGETVNPNGKTQCVFGCCFYQGANCWIRVAIAYDLFYVNYFKLVNWNTIPVNGVNDVEIKPLMSSSDSGNYSFTLNGVTHEYSNNGLANTETNADILLFENIANNETYFHGDIAYFKITDTSSNVKMHLIPCRLLRPIPAALDANGIARNAEECGMYNLVNGLFYGNVGSGSFTVSDD